MTKMFSAKVMPLSPAADAPKAGAFAEQDSGNAHVLFNELLTSINEKTLLAAKEAKKKGAKAAKPKKQPKGGLTLEAAEMVAELQRRRLLFFASKEKRAEFINTIANGDKSGLVDFNCFFNLYEQLKLRQTATALEKQREQLPEDEFTFVANDEDADMELSKAELLAMLTQQLPAGQMPPEDAALVELVDSLIEDYDADKSLTLSYKEFEEASSSMRKRLNNIVAAADEEAATLDCFNRLVRDEDLDEEDLIRLERARCARGKPAYSPRVAAARFARAQTTTLPGHSTLTPTRMAP